MPVTKPHLGKRIMKGDTAPNYLWSYYNRVTKATAGESSVFELRDKGEEMSSKTLSRAALSRSPRHFISRSHHHCSRSFFTKTQTERLLSNFLESAYILLQETNLRNLPLPVSSKLSEKIVSWNVKWPILL